MMQVSSVTKEAPQGPPAALLPAAPRMVACAADGKKCLEAYLGAGTCMA